MQLRKNIKGAIWLAVLAALLYLGGYLFIGRSFVPSEFTEHRRQGAGIAKELVSLTEVSLSNLDEISEKDRQYKFGEALDLVRQELARAEEMRAKAFELTDVLTKMIPPAAQVEPEKASKLAIEAIGYEVSLINHFRSYNDILVGLFQTLEYKFSGDIRYDAEDVQNLIKGLNQEASEINRLNNLYNEKMAEFDKLVS